MSEEIKPASEEKMEIKEKVEVKAPLKTETKKVAPTKEGAMIALVRIRGDMNVNEDISSTMDMLCLYNRNYCSIQKAIPSILGMIRKCKDYITWGEIDEATLKELIEKRAEPNPKDPKKTKKFFRLNSPVKGYGRKGVKMPFTKGGALGNRGSKISDLIKRML